VALQSGELNWPVIAGSCFKPSNSFLQSVACLFVSVAEVNFHPFKEAKVEVPES
jgi:hypothetical protein